MRGAKDEPPSCSTGISQLEREVVEDEYFVAEDPLVGPNTVMVEATSIDFATAENFRCVGLVLRAESGAAGRFFDV